MPFYSEDLSAIFKLNVFVVSYGGGERCAQGFGGSLTERDHWGDPDVDGEILLRWTCRKWEGVVGTGWSSLRIRTGGGHL